MGEQHRSGYNGIAELMHTDNSTNVFVPFNAGFNLEHIFGGDSLISLFEPRRHPMSLYRNGTNSVLLYQRATPLSGVESLTEFKVAPPYYIDITFRCSFQNLDFFRNGYAGLFWASYINNPDDKKTYFKGKSDNRDNISWIGGYSSSHGEKSTHRDINDNFVAYFADNFNATLANHYFDDRFEHPFFYGKFGNMVLAFLFDSEEIIRFSQSPNGGGPTNPAWDFQYIVPSPQVAKEYEFKARMVYKPFVNNKDVLSEYEAWK